MARPANKPEASPRAPWLRRTEQFTLGVLLLSGLVALSGYLAWQSLLRHRLIEIEAAAPRTAQYQVDINAADWAELSQLPGIGETIARRIVDDRKARGPYADHDDLRQRIRGIGPRTLEKIRPYLLPMADRHNVAGSDNPQQGPRRGPDG